MSLVDPNDKKNFLQDIKQVQCKEEEKKDISKQKKPGMFKKLFGGGSKDKDKKNQIKQQ